MTPDDLTALLEKASPLPWRKRGRLIFTGEGNEPLADEINGASFAAIVATMSVAPLLIELWEAARVWRHEEYPICKCGFCQALAKLEKA